MLRPLAPLVALLLVAGCDGTAREEQLLFEDQAILSAISGITETADDATVVSRDPSDWRIGPAYLNRVSFLELPNPNPVAFGEALRFLVDTQGVPGGLRLYVLQEDPVTNALDVVPIRGEGASRPDAAASGFYTFTVSARQIAPGGPGLYRVLLLDGGQGVVSYGDVQVTN